MEDEMVLVRVSRAMSLKRGAGCLLGLVALSLTSLTSATNSPVRDTASNVVIVGMDRLSADLYRHIVGDVFGPTVSADDGRFEPGIRIDGLLAVGASTVSVTETGFERYEAIAREVAGQVVDAKHRDTLVPCRPQTANQPDDACAAAFFSKAGLLLCGRPFKPSTIQQWTQAASESTRVSKDFYSGLSAGLAGILLSPEFLYRPEVAEPDPKQPGQYRLDGYSKAWRLSRFLWNTVPDARLLHAAASGELHTSKGLAAQVDRMLASPKLEGGVRAFFSDMLQFDQFAELEKDSARYPEFNALAVRDVQEQTLRTLVDHLVTQDKDYRDIFTTTKTFLSPTLGVLYRLPVDDRKPNGSADDWVSYEVPQDDPRAAGILAQAGFVGLHSPPTRSSPTIRGKAVREILLCENVPAPPANVNFSVVQDTSNPLYKTTRERLTAHRSSAICAGCHRLVDPIGLALENFDTVGRYRNNENSAPIDASGELDGMKFDGARGLGKALHDDPATVSCVVNRALAYATMRKARKDSDALEQLKKGFAASGYRIPDLFRGVALSDALFRIADSSAIGKIADTSATKQ
jgi:hypothetical protein